MSEAKFTAEAYGSIVAAIDFAKWAYEVHGIADPNNRYCTEDANYIAEHHPDLYTAWMAAVKIGAVKLS